MGKIDKEKLLKEIEEIKFYSTNVYHEVKNLIKNFPEEPEQPIDFDALLKEWKDFDECNGCNKNCDTAVCIIDFLKSKNLTAPKPFEIPVKKTWTLKKDVENALNAFGVAPIVIYNIEPPKDRIEFYDLHEEPDYSKLSGCLCEFKVNNKRKFKIVHKYSEGCFRCISDEENVNNDLYFVDNFVRVVELAKERSV